MHRRRCNHCAEESRLGRISAASPPHLRRISPPHLRSTAALSSASIWLYSTFAVWVRPSACVSAISPPIDSPGMRGTQTEFTSSWFRLEMPIAAGSTLSDGAFVSCIKYTHCTPDSSLR